MSEQSMPDSLAGFLLFASPALLDPHFRKTVLYLTHHTEKDGAMGFVLNRPLDLTFGEVASGQTHGSISSMPVFYGGPVAADQPLLLGMRWIEDGGIELRNFETLPETVPSGWESRLRFVVGHAGWSPGQLEGEIEQQSWIVIPPRKEVIEASELGNVWKDTLRELDPMLKLLADAPDHPEWN